MVSGTHVHFGCRGDQSPSGQQSKQWEPQTAVSSLLGLISVAYPLSAWTAFPFILSIHHKITLVVSGKHLQLMETVTSLMAEGSLSMGLVDCLVMAWLRVSVGLNHLLSWLPHSHCHALLLCLLACGVRGYDSTLHTI